MGAYGVSSVNESTASSIFTWLADHPVLSGFVIFLIALSESLAIVGILVPGIILMLIIGAYLATGQFSFLIASLLAFTGAVIGDGISYYLGNRYKDKLTTLWPISRYPATFEQGIQFFKRHGNKSIILGRFIGPIRAFIPAIAGMFQMSRPQFFISNVLSAAIWAPLVLLPGYAIGLSLALAGDIASRLIIFVIVVGALLWLIFWLLKIIFSFLLLRFNKGLNIVFNKLLSNKITFQLSRKINIAILALIVIFLFNTFHIDPIKSQIFIIENTIWQEHFWNKLESHRKGFITKIKYPFNIQFSGTAKSITQKINSLAMTGESKWMLSPAPQASSIIQLLNPQADITSLAIFPHTHHRIAEQLRFIKKINNELIVIRLWKTQFKIKQFNPEYTAMPLWQGTLTKLVVVEQLGLKVLKSELINEQQLTNLALSLNKNNYNTVVRKNDNIDIVLTSLQ